MPIKFNETVIMDDNGVLTKDFSPKMLGEGYEDVDMFKETKDLPSILKSAVDLRRQVSKKLENVIQKPAQGAKQEEIDRYNKEIRAAMNVPETDTDYEFTQLEGIPEDTNFTSMMKKAFLKAGVSKEGAKILSEDYNNYAKQIIAAQNQEMTDAFNTQSESFMKAFPGDNMKVAVRTAVKAMLQFSDAEFSKKVIEAGILKTPEKLDLVKEATGIWPAQLHIWYNIGKAMKSDEAISDEGNKVTKGNFQEGSKEKVVSSVYNHPTSIKDRQRRGLNY